MPVRSETLISAKGQILSMASIGPLMADAATLSVATSVPLHASTKAKEIRTI